MSIAKELGIKETVSVETPIEKPVGISPFDYVNSISFNKKDLMVDEWAEKQYTPFLINKSLSFGADTVIFANEMNYRSYLDRKMQYYFLLNIVKPKKRYNKWLKAEKVENIEIVKEYYGYNTKKALEALSLLTQEQIDQIKIKLRKGGT